MPEYEAVDVLDADAPGASRGVREPEVEADQDTVEVDDAE